MSRKEIIKAITRKYKEDKVNLLDLPTKRFKDVEFYKDDDGKPKFNPGDILEDGDGISWLIVI